MTLCTNEGLRRLGLEVIAAAIKDINSGDKDFKRSARTFLLTDPPVESLIFWCGLAQVEVDAVQERARVKLGIVDRNT